MSLGSKEFWGDVKKGFGYLIETAMVLGNPVILRLCINAGWDVDFIAFVIGMYSALSIVMFILIGRHWGTFDKADLENARTRQQGVQDNATKNIVAVDNRETLDVIEAKKANISIEDLKKKKYGDPLYDYGKSAAQKVANEARMKELQEEMAKLQAQSTPQPTPTPTPPTPPKP